jgi:hypothetical protein
MSNKQGQRIIDVESAGAVALSDAINHLYGNTATLLSRPTGASLLVLHCEAGAFRLQLGDKHATLAGSAPSGSVTDGSGSEKIAAGERLTLPAPAQITACGGSGTDILTYYWL